MIRVNAHLNNRLGEKIGLILVSGLLYSVAIASVDIAANHFPPVTLTALRLTTASAIFCGILYFLRPKYQPSLRSAADITIVGMLNVGLPFLFLAMAVRYISSSLAAVLFNVQPVFTIGMAHLLLADEKLTPAKLMGTLVAISGATLLLLRGETGLMVAHGQGWIGQLFIMLASLSGAGGVVYARIRLRHVNTAVLAAGQVFACTLIFVTLALVVDGVPALASYAWRGWAAMISATVSAPVLGFWLLFYMINKYSASLAGFSGIATPLFSVVIGILLLGEVITLPIAFGALLLLAGVWSLNYF
jgi:drug/metabolite transporter (DMT)-like permease